MRFLLNKEHVISKPTQPLKEDQDAYGHRKTKK